MLDLNATLLGQMITFIIFVWFTMRYVWPPVMKAMTERKEKIAEGLAAGDRGRRELELAQHKAAEYLRDAKIQAASIIESANKRASILVEEAKDAARIESERIILLGRSEVDREVQKAKQLLKHQVALIAVVGAEKILARNIDKIANNELLDKLITEI